MHLAVSAGTSQIRGPLVWRSDGLGCTRAAGIYPAALQFPLPRDKAASRIPLSSSPFFEITRLNKTPDHRCFLTPAPRESICGRGVTSTARRIPGLIFVAYGPGLLRAECVSSRPHPVAHHRFTRGSSRQGDAMSPCVHYKSGTTSVNTYKRLFLHFIPSKYQARAIRL